MQESVGSVFDIHDAVPPACLQRAQALVDLLVKPPPRVGKHNNSNSSSSAGSAAQPLRRVLDIVGAAQAKAAADAAQLPTAQPRQQQQEGGEDRGNAATNMQSNISDNNGADFTLHALRESLGVAEGGMLYRHWVHDPRVFLDDVVRQLAWCVRHNILPVLLPPRDANVAQEDATEEEEDEEEMDVHVQLYPSLSLSSLSTMSPTLCEADRSPCKAGMCAAVIVRRTRALRRRANAQAVLYQRFMSVAAEGQTLQSALDFWEAVSYGDHASSSSTGLSQKEGRAHGRRKCDDLRAFRPLGLTDFTSDEDSSEDNREEEGEMAVKVRQRTARKRQRAQQTRRSDDTAAVKKTDKEGVASEVKDMSSDDSSSSSSSSGSEGEEEDTSTSSSNDDDGRARRGVRASVHAGNNNNNGNDYDDEAERPPAVVLGEATGHTTRSCFVQPPALLIQPRASQQQQSARSASAVASRAAASGSTRAKPGSVLRQDMCGLVAVLYVSLQGMAYVGYPALPPRPATRLPQSDRQDEEKEDNEKREMNEGTRHAVVMPWLLPLDAATSFTRGLLGLS